MVVDEYIQETQEHINQFGDDLQDPVPIINKDQHDNFVTQQDEGDPQPSGQESESSHTAYLNALSEFNKQYELTNKTVGVVPPGKVI